MSAKSTAAAAALGGLIAVAGGAVFDKSADGQDVEIYVSESKKVVINNEVKFIARAKWPDGGKFDVLLPDPPCVIPEHSADGGEDKVDCLCQDAPASAYRWRGRNVCRKELSSGNQCVPSACSATAGEYGDDAIY
jgi:hypothetical protein